MEDKYPMKQLMKILAEIQRSFDLQKFKAWFRGSKVVRPDGKPRIVYHGTTKSFSSFDATFIGTANDFGNWGAGFYFTDSGPTAKGYADVGSEEAGGAPTRIIQAFLNIKNPYMWPDNKDPIPREQAHAFPEYLQSKGYDGVIFKGGGIEEYVVYNDGQVWVFSKEEEDQVYDELGL